MRERRSPNRGVACAVVTLSLLASLMLVPPADAATRPICPNLTAAATSSMTMSAGEPQPLNPCPGFEWAKTFGSAADWERTAGFDLTSDGGAVLLVAASPSGYYGFTVVKMDGEGVVQWQRFFDRGQFDGDIQQTSDGGYVVTIIEESLVDVFKLDGYGQLLWQTSFEGGRGNLISETQDGGFVVSVIRASGGSAKDLWVLRLDPAGGIVWQKTYGDAGFNSPMAGVIPTPDGGFVAAGEADGGGGWIVKMDASGNIVWQKKYTGVRTVASIATTTDGGYVFTGGIFQGGVGRWGVVKLTASGTISWQKTYGQAVGLFGSIAQTADGGYVTSAVLFPFGNYDFGLMRLDPTGKKLWQRSYGGPLDDYPCYPRCVMEAADGNIVVAGYTRSYGLGGQDAWVLRVFSDGTISSTCDPSFGTSLQNPTVQGAKIKVSNLRFGTTSTSVTPGNPGATAGPGFLTSMTQCSA